MQLNQNKQPEHQGNPILERLRAKITSSHEVGFDGTIYQLARELGCLGELIGREYRVIYDENNRIIGINQLPIRMSQLLSLIAEAKKDEERQKRDMEKSKRKH